MVRFNAGLGMSTQSRS